MNLSKNFALLMVFNNLSQKSRFLSLLKNSPKDGIFLYSYAYIENNSNLYVAKLRHDKQNPVQFQSLSCIF